MSKLKIFRVELTGSARRRLAALSSRHRMRQRVILSRLLEWFVARPPAMQTAAQGHYPPTLQAEISQLILKRLQADQHTQAAGSQATVSGGSKAASS